MAGFKKILFPVDLSEASGKIVPFVREMAEKFGAEVHVIYVAHVIQYYEDIGVSHVYMFNFEAEVLKSAESKLQEFITAEFPGREVKAKVISGYPSEEIIKYIEAEEIELVIMGHSRIGLQRVIFGSVAGHVVKYSPAPVMIISPQVLREKTT